MIVGTSTCSSNDLVTEEAKEEEQFIQYTGGSANSTYVDIAVLKTHLSFL